MGGSHHRHLVRRTQSLRAAAPETRLPDRLPDRPTGVDRAHALRRRFCRGGRPEYRQDPDRLGPGIRRGAPRRAPRPRMLGTRRGVAPGVGVSAGLGRGARASLRVSWRRARCLGPGPAPVRAARSGRPAASLLTSVAVPATMSAGVVYVGPLRVGARFGNFGPFPAVAFATFCRCRGKSLRSQIRAPACQICPIPGQLCLLSAELATKSAGIGPARAIFGPNGRISTRVGSQVRCERLRASVAQSPPPQCFGYWR